jgi:hypothetical protein
MIRLLAGLITFIAVAAPSNAQTSEMPRIQKNGGAAQMFVDGRPFVMLGGELHNSSASSVEYMTPVWPKLTALRVNTVIGTVSWELVEPEEGKFDFSLVDYQIEQARQRNLRLVLIWFASWKNAASTYAPLWVKTNPQRFPRIQTKPRPDLKSPYAEFFSEPMPNLTPLGEESMAADANAFRHLMRHIREVDPQHTVIMMQVENETGLLLDSRDRSPLAEAAWSKPAPAELMSYLAKHKATLLPELLEVWGRNGYKTSGTWGEVFGTDNYADEIFMAWHVGRYVGRVVEAGKAELPLPMYVNAWLGPQPRMEQPGQYPSGGPVARVMDIWRAAAPAVDLFAPDIYVDDFKGTCALYHRSGNPLFIPEARALVGNLFWALGKHSAMGFSPFGIEDVDTDSQLAEAYGVLEGMLPQLAEAQADGKVMGILLEDQGVETALFGGYQITIGPAPARRRPEAKAQAEPTSRSPRDTRPYGMILATGPDEFVIIGSGLLLRFTDAGAQPKIVEIGSIDEGRFERGQWVPGRRLNGDEGLLILWPGRIGVLKVRLYRRG